MGNQSELQPSKVSVSRRKVQRKGVMRWKHTSSAADEASPSETDNLPSDSANCADAKLPPPFCVTTDDVITELGCEKLTLVG